MMPTILRPNSARWPGWRAASWQERSRQIGATVVQAGRDMATDSAFQWAAAIAYYSLLSLFPLLLAAASIAAYFVEPEEAVSRFTMLFGEFVPQGEGQIERIVQEAIAARGTTGFLSTLTLLWSGSRVFAALTIALNVAYDSDETYGFFKRLLVELVILLTVGLVFILALASNFLIDLLWSLLRVLPARQGLVYAIIRQSVPPALLFIAFALIYRFVPRRKPSWLAALISGIVATLLFIIARPLFVGYIERFGEQNIIYGSIAIVIIMVLWAYIVALITLFGGELTAHIQQMIIEGRPAEEIEQRHQERSVKRQDGKQRHQDIPPALSARPGGCAGAAPPSVRGGCGLKATLLVAAGVVIGAAVSRALSGARRREDAGSHRI